MLVHRYSRKNQTSTKMNIEKPTSIFYIPKQWYKQKEIDKFLAQKSAKGYDTNSQNHTTKLRQLFRCAVLLLQRGVRDQKQTKTGRIARPNISVFIFIQFNT